METTSIVVVTLGGVPLGVRLEWPFHGNVSGADFYVLHGTAELGDGSGLHAQVALHLTRVVAEGMPSMEPEHTLGPVLGAIRKQTDRKQLEFLRSDKRQPIQLGGRFQDFRSKVEARRGSRHRTAFPRKDGLVALTIRNRVRAVDVGWQRHVTEPVHRSVNILITQEVHCTLTALTVTNHFGGAAVVKLDDVAGAELTAGTNQRAPLACGWIEGFDQHYLKPLGVA